MAADVAWHVAADVTCHVAADVACHVAADVFGGVAADVSCDVAVDVASDVDCPHVHSFSSQKWLQIRHRISFKFVTESSQNHHRCTMLISLENANNIQRTKSFHKLTDPVFQ